MSNLIPSERIENKIFLIRGHKVMIDRDLAVLYRVSTFKLNKAVKRNAKRFPNDFMFQLRRQEYRALRFQTGILAKGQHSKYLPYAFTENGIVMLSSVLRSERAIEVNIQIMRAFTRLRQVIAQNKGLSFLFNKLKHKVDQHDIEIGLIIKTIEKMMATEVKPSKKIGFLNE